MIDEMVYLNQVTFDLDFLAEELEHATRYIAENEVIHKKVKKGVPTVIEYQGRRYVLDMSIPKKTYIKENEEWEKRFYDRD